LIDQGEETAAAYLAGLGYQILQRNYRSRWGEVDIVAREGPVVVFVEVKRRSSRELGAAVEAVGRGKRYRLIRTAACFLGERGWWHRPCRFDVVAIQEGENVELIRNAF